MAYLIFTANGYELDRKELTGPAVIGRAPDADFHVRDILLSRHHCRIEPAGKKATDAGVSQWVVTDLGSKNGTYIGATPIAAGHVLRDGDELKLGRTRVTFRAGALDPNHPGKRRSGAVVRPLDPAEALEGTVSGFTLVEPDQVEREDGAPVPKPRPLEPSAYQTEDVYGMLNEIASSSWDSIQEQASRPIVKERPLPRPKAYKDPPRIVRNQRVAFSLQADPEAPQAEVAPAADVESAPPRPPRDGAPRMRRPAMLAGVAVAATTVLVGGWLAVVLGGAQFEARQIANAVPPRVTEEIVLKPHALESAAPASQQVPAEVAPQSDVQPNAEEEQRTEEQATDEQVAEEPAAAAAEFQFPPRAVLMAGLRDVAVHRLILR